jgi:hypothetical protein
MENTLLCFLSRGLLGVLNSPLATLMRQRPTRHFGTKSKLSSAGQIAAKKRQRQARKRQRMT